MEPQHTLDALTGPDLEFPLGRHDLSVDTRNLNTSEQASLVVSLHDISAVDLGSADTAVIGTLRSWEASLRPAVWPAIGTEEGVLLLQAEPGLLLGIGVHETDSFVTVVELVGGSIVVPGLAQDEDVLAATEGIWVDGNGAQVDVGVVARGLAGGGAVEVPFRELFVALHWAIEGLQGSRVSFLQVETSVSGTKRQAWWAYRFTAA